MQNVLSQLMVVAFLVESFFEVRLQLYLRSLLEEDRAPADLQKRIRRIVRIDNRWNWGSWLLIIFMLVVPNNWAFLAICIITLLETLVVMEMDHIRTRIKQR
ncbi:hypothetical protein [Limosilactobacillus gorillae]|uniref:hypothetical protein n=1 Tax=Limosilactobacillus gorillae TaxID=1450649 RepID=UPI000A7665F7|nr:hypothetical protein [Limosilactobacillus gorillae]